jgi:hypothetical protein
VRHGALQKALLQSEFATVVQEISHAEALEQLVARKDVELQELQSKVQSLEACLRQEAAMGKRAAGLLQEPSVEQSTVPSVTVSEQLLASGSDSSCGGESKSLKPGHLTASMNEEEGEDAENKEVDEPVQEGEQGPHASNARLCMDPMENVLAFLLTT